MIALDKSAVAALREHRAGQQASRDAGCGTLPATLALAAGADLKVVQDQLGDSTIVLTADTCTSVLPETARTAAELTATLLFPTRNAPAGRGSPLTPPT